MRERRKVCFFLGHRDTPASLYDELIGAAEQLITAECVYEFVVGHYGNFDRMAARAVLALKIKHPPVRLIMLLPYHPASGPPLPPGFDGSWYPAEMEGVPLRVAIPRANRLAIDRATHLIAYVRYPGKAREGVAYARRRDVRIVEL